MAADAGRTKQRTAEEMIGNVAGVILRRHGARIRFRRRDEKGGVFKGEGIGGNKLGFEFDPAGPKLSMDEKI